MNYLFLAYTDPGKWQDMPAGKQNAFVNSCRASDEALQEAGYLVAGGSLQEGDTVTVRIFKGEIFLNQGLTSGEDKQPFGFFLIHARDLNEAIRIASRMPQAQRGKIEIRPLIHQHLRR